jgi:hypothetical protein
LPKPYTPPHPHQHLSGSRGLPLEDQLYLGGDLVALIWHHKLWWLVPVLLALVVLGLLIVVQATPLGPLIYPVI